MRSKLLWLLPIVGVVITGLCYRYLTEEYQAHIWTGESKQARLNPYLAAQKFLQERNVTVEPTIERLDFESIPTGDLVFLSKVDSMLVSQSQIDAALDWVSRGGYLLVGVVEETSGGSSILTTFDIEPEYQDIDIVEAFINSDGDPMSASERMREANRKIEQRRIEREQQLADDKAVSKELSDGDSPRADEASRSEISGGDAKSDDQFDQELFDLLNADFEHEFYVATIGESATDEEVVGRQSDEIHLAVLDRIILTHPDSESAAEEPYILTGWLDDEYGQRMLQFNYGDGIFTVMSSTELWTNSYIGLGDHAYFLSYLIPDESTLHLFYNISAPSLSSILSRYFYEALWASLILLALWLWARGVRVEPVIEAVQGQRRNFAEHIASSAKFLVANKQFDTLLVPIVEDIDRQMRRFYPAFSQMNEHTKAAMLAEKTELPESTVQRWLGYCDGIETQQQLFAALKIGNAIRKKL
jgi:hypothetical protein